MSNVPLEIVYYILDYVADLDIRRSFGIYRKINMNKYQILTYVTRTLAPEYVNWRHSTNYFRYNLRNKWNVPGRELQIVNNDNIDVQISVTNTAVRTVFGINRLQKRSGGYEKELETSVHKIGNLDDYYWDYICYQHINV